jgi:hypothetical protein
MRFARGSQHKSDLGPTVAARPRDTGPSRIPTYAIEIFFVFHPVAAGSTVVEERKICNALVSIRSQLDI